MSRFNGSLRWAWSILVVCTMAFALGGCDGDDGAAGAAGSGGPPGPIGPPGPGVVPDTVAAAIDAASVESCSTCHSGAGDNHYAEYAKFTDASTFALTIDSVVTAPDGAGGFNLTLDFSITHDGAPYIDAVGLAPSVDMVSFYTVTYDSGTGEFSKTPTGEYFPSLNSPAPASNGDGTYTIQKNNMGIDLAALAGGAIIGKIGMDVLDIEDKQAGKRLTMYADLSTDAYTVGDINTFESVANVESCEACHGSPYRKHGNYDAMITGTPDFLYCKACHTDDRAGGHEDWQYMVDDPLGWATDVPATGDYAYQAVLMNDVHMSHAMEFPYPQSMANCATCHEGKLAQVTDDTLFTADTCQSCHVLQGIEAWPEDAGATLEGQYAQPHRPPPLEFLWTRAGVEGFHNIGLDCTVCHETVIDVAPTFAEYHDGYDDHIYDAAGQKYSDVNTVSVNTVTRSGDLLTVGFTATNPAISPTLAISFYGWDTKHFIVPAHERDGNGIDCPHSSRPGCNIEWSPGSTKPFFTEDAASVAGDWLVTFDMSLFQAVKTDAIPQLIADGAVKYAEITILPMLEVGTEDVVLEAVSTSYDLGGSLIVEDYFQGANASVDIEKCNACHDTLGSTFHAGRGRGGDSMQTCKTCHATTFPGSHLELASRSIDSYVHAIHTFQPFDEDDVAAADDPVFDARNAQHKSHVFPYFTALACEGCHVAGTYNAPDQSKSMPGVLRASWDIADRNIGTVPEYVTGPASRACGACHRANMIIDDRAGDLASFNAHTDAFGTLEENDDEDLILFGIIDKIMSMFQ
jgi:OmcA/MtrC family decaheme c-type cytochrome